MTTPGPKTPRTTTKTPPAPATSTPAAPADTTTEDALEFETTTPHEHSLGFGVVGKFEDALVVNDVLEGIVDEETK